MAYVIYCSCVAIFLVLGCTVFLWQVICAMPLPECRPRGNDNNTFLNLTSGSSVLLAASGEWRSLLSTQATLLTLVLLLLPTPAHTHAHFHSYCMHTKLNIPVTNLYKPISGLSVDRFQMGVAGKRKRSHQCHPRISLCGTLVRYTTRKTIQAQNIFSP